MSYKTKSIAVTTDWEQFCELVKLYAAARNNVWNVKKLEIEDNLKIDGLVLKNVGELLTKKDKVKFRIFNNGLTLSYHHDIQDQSLIEFIEYLDEFKGTYTMCLYGVDKDLAHFNARQLIKKEFFWSNIDELSPFGNDEGAMALEEFREWRKRNQNEGLKDMIRSYLGGDWQYKLEDYLNETVLDKELVIQNENDVEFDTHYNYFVQDISIIAVCFGQFIDEGTIDTEVIDILKTSINKLIIWSEVSIGKWDAAEMFIERLEYLKSIVNEV